MKIAHILSFATIALALEAAAVTTATLSLKDGSTLRAELKTEKIACSTVFAKALGLEPAIVKSISFTGKEGEAKIELVNGDTLTASIDNPSFKVSSMLGELDIPKEKIRKIALSPAKELLFAENGLVFHCTFDDEASITSPAAGPGGAWKGGKFVPGKVGNALSLPAHQLGARFKLGEGVVGKRGTIEFYAKIDEVAPLTDGGCPRFFEIIDLARHIEISQDWNANNGGGGRGLTFRLNGLPWMASSTVRHHSPESLLKPVDGWHKYTLAWDVDGLGPGRSYSALVYIDDIKVMTVPFKPGWEGPRLSSPDATLNIPNREDEMPGYAKRAYSIDEFKIYNFARYPVDL